MTQPPSNPPPDFPLSPQDALEFMQKMWNPFGVPMPGFGVPGAAPQGTPAAVFANPMGGMPFPNPAAMFVTLDPAEIQRKIDELKVVDGWLQMSLNMMQMSIKTMELQRASLDALRSAQAPAKRETGAQQATTRSPGGSTRRSPR
ncbi:MAG: hypothetical protein GZ089_11450 [Aromatoleum sp.]|nr:hypothetical protein [Aromatoleum sp.]